jgi:hypothetical protein
VRREARARAPSRLASPGRIAGSTLFSAMPSTWVWMQIAIIVFVVLGMIVAITKLA